MDCFLVLQKAGIRSVVLDAGTRDAKIEVSMPAAALGDPDAKEALAQITVPASVLQDTQSDLFAGAVSGLMGSGFFSTEGRWHDLSLAAMVDIALRAEGPSLLHAPISAVKFTIPDLI